MNPPDFEQDPVRDGLIFVTKRLHYCLIVHHSFRDLSKVLEHLAAFNLVQMLDPGGGASQTRDIEFSALTMKSPGHALLEDFTLSAEEGRYFVAYPPFETLEHAMEHMSGLLDVDDRTVESIIDQAEKAAERAVTVAQRHFK